MNTMKMTMLMTIVAITLLALVAAASAEEQQPAALTQQQVKIVDLGGPDNYIINTSAMQATNDNEANDNTIALATQEGALPTPQDLGVNDYVVYSATAAASDTETATITSNDEHSTNTERDQTEAEFPGMMSEQVDSFPYTSQDQINITVDGQEVPQNKILDIVAYQDDSLVNQQNQPVAEIVEAVQ